MQDKIAIIDLDSLIFSAAHPEKVYDSQGEPIRKDGKFVYKDKSYEEMFESADFFLNTMLEETGSTSYIAYIKGKGNFRYSFNPDYKSDRNKESPHFWEPIKNHLIGKWNAVVVNGIEVDDAVNITRLKVENSFICAIDSDQLGLRSINPHYNWRKKQWITVTKDEENHKFWSDMICGTHNCTKGIPKKGPAYVNKLFHNAYLKSNDGFDMNYHEIVLTEFIKHFGEYEGISEFYKNYRSIKLLEHYDDFEVALPIKFSRAEDPSWI